MIATRNVAKYESRNRTGNTLYMLKTQKPLSWFLLAFLTEQGRRYCTDFDGERYPPPTDSGEAMLVPLLRQGYGRAQLASQPCCRVHNRIDDFTPYLLEFNSCPHFLLCSLQFDSCARRHDTYVTSESMIALICNARCMMWSPTIPQSKYCL